MSSNHPIPFSWSLEKLLRNYWGAKYVPCVLCYQCINLHHSDHVGYPSVDTVVSCSDDFAYPLFPILMLPDYCRPYEKK